MMLWTLARASVEGAVFIAAIAILIRMMPQLSASARAALWWCAAAKFIVSLLWIPAVVLPVLPADSGPAEIVTKAAATVNLPATLDSASTSRTAAPASGSIASAFPWSMAMLGIWSGGVLLTIVVGVARWCRTRRLLTQAAPAPSAIEAMTAKLAEQLSLETVPAVRMSNEIQTPLVAGLRQPVIFLPAGRFLTLSIVEQRMAICHELAHVKRADLWLGCVPALAEHLFFFHPLVHLATREYAFWRESACDLAVLDTIDAAPQDYGRLLLALGISQPRTGSMAAAGAPWSFSSLKRRIVMLGRHTSGSLVSRSVGAFALSVAVLAMVPFELGARPGPQAPEQPLAPLTDASSLDPKHPRSDAAAWRDLAGPEAKQDKKARDINYVMLIDDHHTSMSGSMDDIEKARRFKRANEPLLWFRQNGREYVVRDRALLAQVAAIWKPVNEIGEAQGVLGEQQGDLGARQGQIGERQGQLGEEQGRLGERQGDLGERQAALEQRYEGRRPTTAERQAFENERQALEAEMRALDVKMAALEVRMRELDKPMQDLEAQMHALDKEMSALDRKMEAAVHRAEDEMRALLDRAIASGAAEAVK
jgi:bla regulator protein blaR1